MNGQTPLKMYNLNVNVATALGGGLLGIDGQCNTPRTPEILNSLIAMTNPFDSLNKTGQENTSPLSEESSSGVGSPLGSPTTSPPSVQHTCSQLIKEGLKLTLQSKRKLSSSDSRDDMDDFQIKRAKSEELTQEDEERRKRRRERNKIAATKCRMKKREKTTQLVKESETLESQNIDMKTQIQELEKQRLRLMTMLSQHAPHCVKGQSQQSAMSQNQQASQAAMSQTFDPFTTVADAFLDPDFGDSPALISYNKDPNLGKHIDNYYGQNKLSRGKSESLARGSYHCEEEDPDVYRPNIMLDSYFNQNDSGYSSFNSSQLDHSCRA